MRALSSFIFLLVSIYTCKAQVSNDAYSDSLCSSYRANAEQVISHCIKMDCDILLYTTGNQYYIITYSHDTYQEYYVAVDSLNRIINFYDNSHDETIKRLETKNNLSLKKRKYLSRLLYDKKIILETFDTIQHSKSLISSEPITSIPFCEISPSYFVIKERNNVIVEYFSESNLLPYPINLDLSTYLLRELASCRTASANIQSPSPWVDLENDPVTKTFMEAASNE